MTLPADIAAVRGIIEYLKTYVSEFNDILDEFPNHGDELELPSCSVITVGEPVFMNLMPYTLKTIADPEAPINDIVYTVIGQFDLKLQVDLWAEYKIQRSQLIEAVQDALNKDHIDNDGPTGLRLILDDYHGVISSFDMISYSYINDENTSSKGCWRAKLDLVVNYPKLVVKSIPRIDEITVKSNVDNKEWEDSNEEIKIL